MLKIFSWKFAFKYLCAVKLESWKFALKYLWAVENFEHLCLVGGWVGGLVGGWMVEPG